MSIGSKQFAPGPPAARIAGQPPWSSLDSTRVSAPNVRARTTTDSGDSAGSASARVSVAAASQIGKSVMVGPVVSKGRPADAIWAARALYRIATSEDCAPKDGNRTNVKRAAPE